MSTAIAKALFDALASNNSDAVRSLCSPQMRISQNHGAEMGVEDLINFNEAVQKVVKNFRYENAVRTETSNGFIEEHSVCATLADGSELKIAACVVGEVVDGKIVSAREYADSMAAIGLFKALNPSG